MRETCTRAFRFAGGIFTFLFVFMMMSNNAMAADAGFNAGAAVILDQKTTQPTEAADGTTENADTDEASDSETAVLVSAGATADETIVALSETEEEEETSTLVMANVSDSVNVREESSEEAQAVGKLYKNCSADIVEEGEGWTKIQSGNVVGWVSNDYLVFGEDAQTMLEEVGSLKATIQTDALRVRKEASEDAGVYGLVKNGETLTAVEELGDWVSVQFDEETVGYISAEYVSVAFDTEHGKTNQEIEDEERAKQLKKLSKNQGAVPTSVSDVTLLAALIQAEAGTQSYEGKLAVGAVVMNRVRSGGYPSSIINVITAPGQFPPATNGIVAGIVARGPSSSCMQAAQAAVDGQTNVGGATHFGRVGKAAGVVIGGHVFY